MIEDNLKDTEIPEIDFYVTSNDDGYGFSSSVMDITNVMKY